MKLMLDELEGRFEKLVTALDGKDAEQISVAASDVRGAVQKITTSKYQVGSQIDELQIKRLNKLINASRVRVNILTDINRHRVNNLAPAIGAFAQNHYSFHENEAGFRN